MLEFITTGKLLKNPTISPASGLSAGVVKVVKIELEDLPGIPKFGTIKLCMWYNASSNKAKPLAEEILSVGESEETGTKNGETVILKFRYSDVIANAATLEAWLKTNSKQFWLGNQVVKCQDSIVI